MANPFIRIIALKKHYEMGGQTVRALDGVNLEIEAHTFTVVMGPSGSGKSTLLYLLGGLDRATSGEISIAGERLTDMDENALALFLRLKRLGCHTRQRTTDHARHPDLRLTKSAGRDAAKRKHRLAGLAPPVVVL